jgi:hypothetical protein
MRNEFVTDTQEAEPLTMAALLDRPNADRQKADGMAQKPECVEDKAAALFPAQETENFRQRWSSIQGSFVDTPREAVQQADELVATTVQRLAEIFSGERAKLEGDWTKGNEVSTEDLRQALRRYRSFFDRLLSV